MINNLYQEHSESELRSWASRLKMFRYFRAFGGHANDGDSLDVAFAYANTEELMPILSALGHAPVLNYRVLPI